MRATLFWLLVLLVAVTVFALSNPVTVTVNFWQWPVYKGPLAMAVVGAGVLGALLTYVSSLAHHVHQARHIRNLEERLRGHEARQTPVPAAGAPGTAEARRLP